MVLNPLFRKAFTESCKKFIRRKEKMIDDMDEYRLLNLGAVLHDIGKVIQRDLGKIEGGHSELGYKFLKGLDEDVALFAKFHHKGEIDSQRHEFDNLDTIKRNLLWMVYEADNLSSTERGNLKGEFNPKNPLISVFSRVKLDEEVKEERAYPLTTLGFDDFVFPGFGKDKVEDKIKHKNYEAIYADFKHCFPSLYPDLILAFLEKEATFIPARTGEDEDVSLFDHLKTTCAIASCMYLCHKDSLSKDIKKQIENRSEKKYLLISGDISGIQKFIYNITSKGALKLLRARSFFLEIISEDFVQELLDELNLSRANLLYCAGGHFYLLAPNTEECKEKTDNLKRELNRRLLEKFEGNLYYAIDYLSFSGNQFKDFSKLWMDIGRKVSEQKSKKFREFLIDEPDKFLREDCRDTDYLNKDKRCDACKRFVSELKRYKEKEAEYCEDCYALNSIGTKLANKKYRFILRYRDVENYDLELPFSKIKIMEKIEGRNFNTAFQINSFGITGEVLELKQKADFNFIPLALARYSCGKDLDTLANDSAGINKIGVLRMDVDNLGRIFKEGLRGELRTISRITNLSRFLNYFFKGYLNLFGEFEEKNVKGICNSVWGDGRLRTRKNRGFTIVYAGGDDLLIVGSWDDVLEIAFDINALFKKYVGENDNITISAGFCIFDKKFPFYKMAEISGDKEGIAKNEGKNRTWMFERGVKFGYEDEVKEKELVIKESIEWNKFLGVWKDFEHLLPLLKEKKISKGNIAKLLAINNQYRENIANINWAVQLSYWYGKLNENDKRIFKDIVKKYSVIKREHPPDIFYIDIPLRILDFAARGE